jgi:hypothetical protein
VCVASVAFGCGGDDAASAGAGTGSAGAAGASAGRAGNGNAGAGTGSDAAGASGMSGDGELSWVIDGTEYRAAADTIEATASDEIPGGYDIEGAALPGATQRFLAFSLYNIDAPGTYWFGVSAGVIGAYATLQQPTSNIWHTRPVGTSGTLEVETLTEDRIGGTFELTLTPSLGSRATDTLELTDGRFDLPYDGTALPIGTDQGRSISATIDDEPFYASSVVVTPYPGGLSFNALNDERNIGFILSEIDGSGTYEIGFAPPVRSVVAIDATADDQGTHCCWGASVDDTGTLELTELSEDRIVGTFELTLQPQPGKPATAPLVVTDGRFDIGLAE